MRIVVKNARIADGSGSDLFDGAVLIEGERIAEVFQGEAPAEAEKRADRVIDAAGNVLAPGFIDTHSHSDLKVLSEPELLPKLHQGITTEVLGQDGISM
ncbi:MAG: amidohydrolase family protein, partial [Lachnospiraceae bacterium]|nr:amidohydrolase family protein [Lachnospiraceae bacterium]